jgi:hypothetical protein
MFVAMCAWVRPIDWMREKNLTSDARKSEAHFDAQHPKQKVIAGIPAGGQSGFEPPLHQPSQIQDFPPRPGKEAILVFKGSPRRDERGYLDISPETGLQVFGVGLGQKSDGVFLARRLQEWGGDEQIAETPQFDYQKLWFHR